MSTEIEGELDQLLDLLKQCIEAVAQDCNRVSVTAKLDYRKGHRGSIDAKVASVGDKASPRNPKIIEPPSLSSPRLKFPTPNPLLPPCFPQRYCRLSTICGAPLVGHENVLAVHSDLVAYECDGFVIEKTA